MIKLSVAKQPANLLDPLIDECVRSNGVSDCHRCMFASIVMAVALAANRCQFAVLHLIVSEMLSRVRYPMLERQLANSCQGALQSVRQLSGSCSSCQTPRWTTVLQGAVSKRAQVVQKGKNSSLSILMATVPAGLRLVYGTSHWTGSVNRPWGLDRPSDLLQQLDHVVNIGWHRIQCAILCFSCLDHQGFRDASSKSLDA